MKQIIFNFMRIGTLSILLFLLSAQPGNSQSISDKNDIVKNVKYTVTNGTVYITYDLSGNEEQLFAISLILKKADYKNFTYLPKTVTGDIGDDQTAGKNKEIIWELRNDFPEGLSGEDYYFIVQAEEVDGSANILTWAGIGIAAAVAAVTYIIVGNGNSSENSSNSFPSPPGRP